MHTIPTIPLSNGVRMPQVGFGLMNCRDQDTMNAAVSAAIDAGCRMFDGAYLYGNEKEFGIALEQKLRETGLKRQDVFLVTKIRTSRHAYDLVRGALEAQLENLRTDYVDLYLIHWPMPGNGLYLEAWRAFEDLCDEGLIRAPGVCNCFEPQLQRILDICRMPPAVNQIQTNPYYVNKGAVAFCRGWTTRSSSGSPPPTGKPWPRSSSAGWCSRTSCPCSAPPSPSASGRASTCTTSPCPRRTWPASTPWSVRSPDTAGCPATTPSAWTICFKEESQCLSP